MKKRIGVIISIIVILVLGVLLARNSQESVQEVDEVDREIISNEENTMTDITLTSAAFESESNIPSQYTCDGDDISPALEWTGVPEEAKSLVLIMDDPDAVKPAGYVWDHWVVFNIQSTTDNIQQGEEPEGIAGNNSWLRLGYRGPCPPDGEHRYFFKIYALDSILDLEEGTTKAEVEAAMEGHILAQGQLIGRYTRQ